jgi:hypothetical protein
LLSILERANLASDSWPKIKLRQKPEIFCFTAIGSQASTSSHKLELALVSYEKSLK